MVEQKPHHLDITQLTLGVQCGGTLRACACLILAGTTLEQQPRHLEMALLACEVQRGAPKSTVRREVVLAALHLITFHCIGVGAVIEKALHRNQIAIKAHLNEIPCCWLGGGPGGAAVSGNEGNAT